MGFICLMVAIFNRRINRGAWRKLAENAVRLGTIEEPAYAPLAAHLDVREELAVVRRSRAVHLAVAAAAPFVVGFYAYAGFAEKSGRLSWMGATVLVVYLTWLWSERRYRRAVFARAAEQGLV